MRIVAFVPMKMHNERLPGKHLLPMPDGRPLMSYALETVSFVRGLDARHIFCSDTSIRQHIPDGFIWTPRQPSLDDPRSGILDTLVAFARAVPGDVYVLIHATAPFLKAESIEKALSGVVRGDYDSAVAVRRSNQFLWMNGAPINYSPTMVPRTQDLSSVYAETTGMYIYGRDLLLERGRRIGERPYLVEVSAREAVDVNEEIDYRVALAMSTLEEPDPAF